MHAQSDYLTSREAAELLRISIHTLNHWRICGRGPAFIKIGSAVRYARRDVDAWADRHRVRAGDIAPA
jgi:excisionase family DNA binding protein